MWQQFGGQCVRRVERVVAIFALLMLVSSSAFAAKGAIVNCTWQLPEVRIAMEETRSSSDAATRADPKADCMKETKKAEFKRGEYIACLAKHTKRFHAGGASSVEAAQEAAKFCDARITLVERTEPGCAADFRRIEQERRQAELWCQTDAKCRDTRQRADEWYVCARSIARVDEKKCVAARSHDLDQERVDLRISEECQPRTEQPDTVALYRKMHNAAQAGKPITKAGGQPEARAEK